MKYADPYLAGAGLGLVLVAAFVVTGHGLGASGAFAASAAGAVASMSPGAVEGNAYLSRYLAGGGPLSNWLVWEIAGVLLGGAASAVAAGRWRLTLERGDGSRPVHRIAMAIAGGAAMGAGAMLARGCTSGQALSGGAMLSVGSWTFLLTAFAAGFGASPLVRASWR